MAASCPSNWRAALTSRAWGTGRAWRVRGKEAPRGGFSAERDKAISAPRRATEGRRNGIHCCWPASAALVAGMDDLDAR